jgi:hypothetical protein
MASNELEEGAAVLPLPTISSRNQNKALLEWLHSLQRWGGHACRFLTKGFHSRAKSYVEFQQLDSFAIKELAVLLHITTYSPQYLTVLSSLLCPSSNCTARRFFVRR